MKLSDAQAETIMRMVATGETIISACRTLGIAPQDFWEYRRAHPDFADQFSEARKAGVDAILDEATAAVRDALRPVDSSQPDVLARARVDPSLLRAGVDGALRLAAKLDPARYSDRVDLHVSAALPLAPALAAADARARQLEAERSARVIEGVAVRVKGALPDSLL